MLSNYTYLLINICSLLIPLALSFEKRVAYHKKFPNLFIAMSITAFLFLIWDYFFTSNGIWGFNAKYLIGIYIFNLPLEEILFFFAIPFSSIFIYEVIKYYNSSLPAAFTKVLTIIFILISIFMSINYRDLAYTSATFAVLASLLLINLFLSKQILKHFYLAYLITLVPFFIVNGILTGTGLTEPVVWYTPEEKLGIRLMTIPVEDIFYGMGLILMNISIYETLES